MGWYQITVKFKITAKVGYVSHKYFGISPSLVWREMTLEEAQISDTHSLKESEFQTFGQSKSFNLDLFEFLLNLVGHKLLDT